MTFRELGRQLKDLGTPDDRVKVLDVDHSATTYKLPQIEARVRVGVFYLRPPNGVTADQVKELFDQAESPAFRYRVTSGIGTDHMELLTPDDYAREHFIAPPNKLIHIEGARKLAREQLEEMFDEMKEPFDPHRFPHLDDVTISGHKPGSEELSAEVKLLVSDDDFRNMARIERALTHKMSEANLHREVMVGRHLVKDTAPEIILSTTAKATGKGRAFLSDLADYLLDRDGGLQSEAKRKTKTHTESNAPGSEDSSYKTLTNAFPRTPIIVKSPLEIVNRATEQFHSTLAGMPAFKDLELNKIPQGITVHFPRKLIGSKRFESWELTEMQSVYITIQGMPGLHEGWSAYYTYDKGDRTLKIRFTTPDSPLQSPWLKLGKA